MNTMCLNGSEPLFKSLIDSLYAVIKKSSQQMYLLFWSFSIEKLDFINRSVSRSDKYQARCLGSIDSR